MTKLIAEIGWNHMGDMILAREMISSAAEAGADFAKFQTWSVSRLKPGPWDHDGRREIYVKAELDRDQHLMLKEYCEKLGVRFISSVFSVPDSIMLNEITNSHVKIPSAESRNAQLLDHVNDNFDCVFLSTDTSSLLEIMDSVERLDKAKVILLHCVSSYPCEITDANLPRIAHLQALSEEIGYSDHVIGIEAARISLEYGVKVIEKHFTIDNDLPGRDNKFAILPDKLGELRQYIDLRTKAMEDKGTGYSPGEKEVREIYSGRFSGY